MQDKMQGLLIYNSACLPENQHFAESLISHGRALGLNLSLALSDKLSFGCEGEMFFGGNPSGFFRNGLFLLGENLPKSIDFAINRSRTPLLSRTLEDMGVRVFNTSQVSAVGNDKIAAHMLAARLSIKSVPSVFFSPKSGFYSQFSGKFPLVVKSVSGFGGSEVYLANDERELRKAAEAAGIGAVLVQRFLPNVSDVRVFVLGNEILGAVRRTPKTGFRSNLKLGGGAELCAVTPEMENAVLKIIAELTIDFAGIDFLTDGKELFFNEIEDAAGSRSLWSLKNMDTSLKYIEYISEILYN